MYAQGGDDAPAVGSYKGGRCGTIQFIHCCYIEGRGGKNAVAFGCGSKGYCKEISHIWGYDESYGEVIGYAGEGADAVFGHPGDGQCERINVTSITIAYCSKEPTDTMYISDFLKADYVSLMRRPELLDFDWSVWPMEDGFFMYRPSLYVPRHQAPQPQAARGVDDNGRPVLLVRGSQSHLFRQRPLENLITPFPLMPPLTYIHASEAARTTAGGRGVGGGIFTPPHRP